MKIIYISIVLSFLVAAGCGNEAQTNAPVNRQNENKTKVETNKPVVEANKTPGNPFEHLRNVALSTTPEHLDLKLPDDKTIVYGVVMDWNTGDGNMTMPAFQTGEASIYTSTGGGVIGGGAQANVKKAATAFVKKAQSFLEKATITETTPLPEKNGVKFYFLTNKGKFVADEKKENFDNNSSEWLELYTEAHKVITELRLTAEKDKK